MVEIHGWITLRYSDYHSEEPAQKEFVNEFISYLKQQYDWVLTDGVGRISSRNGLECFSIDVQHNHPGIPFYPLEIFTWAAQNSSGSYGLLYVHDNEHEQYHNEFQVYVLKRGHLTKASSDALLSPYEDEVEKAYDANNPPRD